MNFFWHSSRIPIGIPIQKAADFAYFQLYWNVKCSILITEIRWPQNFLEIIQETQTKFLLEKQQAYEFTYFQPTLVILTE